MKGFLQRYLGPDAYIAVTLIFVVFLYAQIAEFRQDIFHSFETEILKIGGQEMHVWIADTPHKRRQGLSVFESIEPYQGMLFVFEKADTYSFWMKDMKFPIDIFWLDSRGQIVFIKEHAQPEDYPESYQPHTDALYVLETVAGFAKHNGVKIGDTIAL